MKKNHPLLIILALALIIRLIFAFNWHEVWWDSGVYIGMGKYIYSGGESGLWEHIRPPLIPIILGLFWKLGLDPVIFGRIFEIILMLGVVWLTYQLARHWWDEKVAIISSLIIALSPIFYYLSFHQYTEIPHTFFALLALWLFTKEKYFLCGISTGLAFLSKFTAGVFIIVILIMLALSKKWKQASIVIGGFALSTSPYFIYSWMAYSNPLATFFAAQDTINRVLGCNVLRARPWWYYGWWLVFSETKIHLMAIPGIYALYKRWKKQHLLFLLGLALPSLYLVQLTCHDYRYLTLVLPFVAMLTALGIAWTYDLFKINKKWVFSTLVILIGIWMLHTSIRYYYGNEVQQPDIIAEEYFSYLQGKKINGEIWTANPVVAAYTDKKLEKIYYPIYGTNLSGEFIDYLSIYSEKTGAVLLDNCGGGIICPPDEPECEKKTEQLVAMLDEKFNRAFDKQSGRCWYRIWVTSSN
ncbi:MAG: glycosyltransferase family 39 protein [Candidatus Woesearchaeota archaeon]